MNSAQSSSWQAVPAIIDTPERKPWFWHRLGATKRSSPPPEFPAKLVKRNVMLMTLGYALFIWGIARIW